MNTTTLKIERIENPTVEYFEKYISASRKPVIITGVVKKHKGSILQRKITKKIKTKLPLNK